MAADAILFGTPTDPIDLGSYHVVETHPADIPFDVAMQALSRHDDATVALATNWVLSPTIIVLAQVAHQLGRTIVELAPGRHPRVLTHVDIIAPLQAGGGILAPDSDDSERPHEEAARIVLGPRGAVYDTPLRNLGRTGLIWSGILAGKLKDGELVTAEDVALCMVGVKLAREAFHHKRDNLTDAHGYLMTVEMILDERDETQD